MLYEVLVVYLVVFVELLNVKEGIFHSELGTTLVPTAVPRPEFDPEAPLMHPLSTSQSLLQVKGSR